MCSFLNSVESSFLFYFIRNRERFIFVLAVWGLLSDMALCVWVFSSSYCESIFAVIEPEAVECIMVSACNLQ